jgi:Uncharacterized protein conserved in bacteria
MDAWTTARGLFPETQAKALERYPDAEEIRLRIGKPPTVVIAGAERQVSHDVIDQNLLHHVLEKATDASLHAAAPAIREGFISYRGLRIGVCGEAVFTDSSLSSLRSFSSLSIRIPHDVPESCSELIGNLLSPQPRNILIAAPPGIGKTSFLRELIRRAAMEMRRVSVIDERNELSASISGAAQFDLGLGSDVMVGVPKEKAAMMLLRGMNPQIIAMDEITQREDLKIIEQITGCGVLLFATAHGKDREDMMKRPLYRKLFAYDIFQELVTIRCEQGKRIYNRERLRV